MNRTVGNTLFKNRVTHLIIYEYDPSEPLEDYVNL